VFRAERRLQAAQGRNQCWRVPVAGSCRVACRQRQGRIAEGQLPALRVGRTRFPETPGKRLTPEGYMFRETGEFRETGDRLSPASVKD